MTERVEETTTQLPAHEGQCGARVGQVQGHGTRSWRVGRTEQVEPTVRIVADLGDALRSDRGGRDAARSSHASSIAATSGRRVVLSAHPRRRGMIVAGTSLHLA